MRKETIVIILLAAITGSLATLFIQQATQSAYAAPANASLSLQPGRFRCEYKDTLWYMCDTANGKVWVGELRYSGTKKTRVFNWRSSGDSVIKFADRD